MNPTPVTDGLWLLVAAVTIGLFIYHQRKE